MVKDIDVYERISKNEEKLLNLKERLTELKHEFESYKKSVLKDKKHSENVFLGKLTLILIVVIAILEFLSNFLLP